MADALAAICHHFFLPHHCSSTIRSREALSNVGSGTASDGSKAELDITAIRHLQLRCRENIRFNPSSKDNG